MRTIIDSLLVGLLGVAQRVTVWLCAHCDGGHSPNPWGQCEFCGHWGKEGE